MRATTLLNSVIIEQHSMKAHTKQKNMMKFATSDAPILSPHDKSYSSYY